MTMQDPISDMLTRIRNGLQARKQHVDMPQSKMKSAIAEILMQEGYIEKYEAQTEADKPTTRIVLKYHNERPVIEKIQRVSRPSMRVYSNKDLPKIDNGLGVAIVSTSKGVMTDKQARRQNLGGEVLCTVS